MVLKKNSKILGNNKEKTISPNGNYEVFHSVKMLVELLLHIWLDAYISFGVQDKVSCNIKIKITQAKS